MKQPKLKDYKVDVVDYVATDHWVKAKSEEDAKNQVKNKLSQAMGGYSTSLDFIATEIEWYKGEYPWAIGYKLKSEPWPKNYKPRKK